MNRLKSGIILSVILAFTATAVAQVIQRVGYGYTSDGTGISAGSVLPGPNFSVGIPLSVNGKSIMGVNVTISDFRDAGASDFQQVGNGRLLALIARPEAKDPDGGVQWARYPAWDIEVDGGNPFIPGGGGAVSYSVQLSTTALGLGNGRLLYFSQGVIGADGGALPHKVYYEGSYRGAE